MAIPERFRQKPFDAEAFEAAAARLLPPDPDANDDDLDGPPPEGQTQALLMGRGKPGTQEPPAE
jgi:hypothetical protein